MSKLLILALCLSLVAMGLACANSPQASIDEGLSTLESGSGDVAQAGRTSNVDDSRSRILLSPPR